MAPPASGAPGTGEASGSLGPTLARWAAAVRPGDIPERVLSLATAQIASQIAAARATLSHPLGGKIVSAFGPPLQSDPKACAYVLAALTMALDFDDTLYAGHVSHSTVSVPLAYATAMGLDGMRLVAAVVVADECAARVTASVTLGPFRGQTAAHTHLAGSVAARMYLENASWGAWARAWGIAFTAPPWTLNHPFFAGESKALLAATQVRAGLDACDAALAGMVGAADVFEHAGGVMESYADVPLPGAFTRGLGSRWHTDTLSIKPYPGCAYIDTAVDCAIALHDILAAEGVVAGPGTVEEVVVRASAFTSGMEKRAGAYIEGAGSPLTALQFSVGYAVAAGLARGGFLAADLAGERLADGGIWALAAKVRVEHDLGLTLAALGGTAPIGEALREAGARATGWLAKMATAETVTAGGAAAAGGRGGGGAGGNDAAGAGAGGEGSGGAVGATGNAEDGEQGSPFGPPSPGFEDATKPIGAAVSVRLSTGEVFEVRRDAARGSPSAPGEESREEVAREKLLATGASAQAVARLGGLVSLDAPSLAEVLADLLA